MLDLYITTIGVTILIAIPIISSIFAETLYELMWCWRVQIITTILMIALLVSMRYWYGLPVPALGFAFYRMVLLPRFMAHHAKELYKSNREALLERAEAERKRMQQQMEMGVGS